MVDYRFQLTNALSFAEAATIAPMSSQQSPILRIVIPIVIVIVGGFIVLSQLNSGSAGRKNANTSAPAGQNAPDPQIVERPDANDTDSTSPDTTATPGAESDQAVLPSGQLVNPERDPGTSGADRPGQEQPLTEPATDPRLTGLHLRSAGPPVSFDPLGDIHNPAPGDTKPSPMAIEFAPGAGISQITLRDYFTTTERTANYQLFENVTSGRPVMGFEWIIINDQWVHCQPVSAQNPTQVESYWTQLSPGSFQAVVVNDSDEPIANVTIVYSITPPDGRIGVAYSIENLTDIALNVRVEQWGPSDLPYVPGGYGDYRRFRFGYLDPRSTKDVLATESDYLESRTKVLSKARKADADLLKQGAPPDPANQRLWPNDTSEEKNHTLAWVATTNRYFTFAVYPHLDDPANAANRALNAVDSISWWFAPRTDWETRLAHIDDRNDPLASRFISTRLRSPVVRVDPGQSHTTQLECYAGPLKRSILASTQPYRYFNLKELVIYQLGCALCTFQWLADVLLAFLRLIHGEIIKLGGIGIGVHDWSISIVILVLCVRALLHPLTKKGQVSMQRFGKKMSALQPEMKKIQAKFKDNPKKLQAEQMRLYKEHNVNPAGCLGMAPMFLQMPIWVALYAMLYFAIELRQQPAVYGIFQLFGNWSFLADMSKPDHFIDFGAPVVTLIPWLRNFPNLTGWPIIGSFSSINVLPILMATIFYFQQKYMTPPQTNLSPEQESQQKIMKIMMILLFPLMLYNAPSGLTLYIITSSTIGIAESRYIRAHVAALDDEKPVRGGNGGKKKDKKADSGVQGFFHRAIEEGQRRQRDKQRRQQKQQKRK